MEEDDRMQVPHKASTTRGAVPRSLPKCRKAPITCGLRRISKPLLEILAEDGSPPGTVAAKPSVSLTPAVAKAKRSDNSLLKLDKHGEAVNSKKQRRSGILPLKRSAFQVVDAEINWNYSEGSTVGFEIRDNNNANPKKRSCSSVVEPQGNSPPKQTLEVGKCCDTIRDSEGSGPIDDKSRTFPSERERSKKKIPRKCNDSTILSVATAVNGEIKPVVLRKVKPVIECQNARASRENINKDTPKASRSPVSKIRSLRDPRRTSRMATSSADRFFQMFGTSGSWEQHNLHEKSHVFGMANNRETSAPSFPQMIQWIGVRHRQRRSCPRKMNITFPLSDSSCMQQVEGCDPSLHERMVSANANGVQCTKDGAIGIPHLKVKLNSRSLPARLPEYGASPSKEISSMEMSAGGVESRKRYAKNLRLSNSILVATKTTKFQSGEILDGKHREERSRKISRFSKIDDSSLKERLAKRDPKPVGAVNKNESNTGSGCPPVGKLSDQMTSTHQENSLLYVNTEDSSNSDECTLPDMILLPFPEETGNDWNQLFEAPNLASKPSCLPSFEDLWKDMESVQMRDKDRSCSKEQGALVDGLIPELQTQVRKEREPIIICQSATAKLATPGCQIHEAEDINTNKLCRKSDIGAMKFGPLFERLLSAFIFEDGRTLEGDDEEILSFLLIGDEDRGRKREDTLIQSLRDAVNPRENSRKNIQSRTSNDVLPKGAPCSMQKEQGFMSEELLTLGSACSDERYRSMSVEIRLLLELQSLGIYPEALPDLINEEDEAIIHDILEVREHVAEQASNSKARVCSKGTSMNDKDLEGAETEEIADPGYIKQPVRIKRTVSWISKPKVPKDAEQASTVRNKPVPGASSGATSSQGKQLVPHTAKALLTQNPKKGGAVSSCTDRGGIRAEGFVNSTSKNSGKGVKIGAPDKRDGNRRKVGNCSSKSNIKTTCEKSTDQALAASEAVTANVYKGEIGSANSGGNEEFAGPSIDMLVGMDLSSWLDIVDDDALQDDDMNGLHIPMDDLCKVTLLL